jgi:sec-independent protein translocase protein TatA
MFVRVGGGFVGPWEILILLLVVLLVFGPKRLPEMGRSLGQGMRDFKNSLSGDVEEPEPVQAPREVRRDTVATVEHDSR